MATSLFPSFPQLPGATHFAQLHSTLLPWFAVHQRDLPWRHEYSPYAVWISEIMLQQTQMERGVLYFNRWMELFPNIPTLAAASLDAVHKAWEGLGYYARAKNLHATAQLLMREHHGLLPATPEALMRLPGIGRYTAGAIASIAHNLPVPVVDANIERVFARLFDVDAPCKGKEASSFFWHIAEKAIPHGKARQFNQALMELGALVCGKSPQCSSCPLESHCQAKHLDLTYERPITGKKAATVALDIITGVLVHRGRVFVQKRLDHGAWAGLWEFPGGRLEVGETPEQAVVREFSEETEFPIQVIHKLGVVRHAYTRYKITLHAFICTLKNKEHTRIQSDSGFPVPALHAATTAFWATPDELVPLAFPAGHRKLLDLWMQQIRDAAAV